MLNNIIHEKQNDLQGNDTPIVIALCLRESMVVNSLYG
jgi:hypothetical protein